MLTPQEIAETPLSKVRFGGYDMGEVDDFLEIVTEDYTALYKENAILKGKLKVLVEKIEEYRKTEDSMRMALFTAQKVSEDIKTDADKHRESVLRDANEEIKAKLAETAKRVADEEYRLSIAAKETSKFIELSQAVMKRHSEFLAKLEAATLVLRETRQYDTKTPASAPNPAPINVPAPAPVKIDSAPTTSFEKVQEKHIGDVADQIDSAMQRLTGSEPAPAAPVNNLATPTSPVAPLASNPVANPSPITAHSTEDQLQMPTFQSPSDSLSTPQELPRSDANTSPTIPFPPVENLEETSPRPKFDFDDLRFGDNF